MKDKEKENVKEKVKKASAAITASPLYPQIERMTLESNFRLGESADAPSSSTSSAPNITLSAASQTPATLLFRGSGGSKASQLNFNQPSPPAETSLPPPPQQLPSITITADGESTNGTLSGRVESGKNVSSADDAVGKMDEDTEEVSAGLSHSLVGKKGTADEKKFPCTEADCSASFSQLAHLKIHLRRHTGERPFVCQFCNKSFNQKGNLKTHERKHTGDKPFKCQHPGCTKEFSQQGNLRTHEKIHLNVKQFTCEQCGKSFSQFGNLKSHIQKVHVKPQTIRRPRANSNTAITKPTKGGRGSSSSRSSAAAAQLISSSAAAGSGSYHLDRYYTPSLTSRPRSSSFAGERLSTSLATPPPSDWTQFDRDSAFLGGEWNLNDFSESEDEDEEEDEEESDEDEFDNFEEEEAGEDDDFVGDLNGAAFSIGEEAKLLLFMSGSYHQESGTSGAEFASSSFQNMAGVGFGESMNGSAYGSLSSSISNQNPADVGVPVGATLSPSMRAVNITTGGVKKRKSKQLPAAAANQVRLRKQSMGKLDLDDGLQFIIDGIEQTEEQQHALKSSSSFESWHSDDVALDEEEAARVLASVSHSPSMSSFLTHPNQVSTSLEGTSFSANHTQLRASRSHEHGLLPLLAATAASTDGSNLRSKHPPVAYSSLSTSLQNPYFGGIGALRRSSVGGSIGGLGKSVERNVMFNFVDAVHRSTTSK